MQEELLMLISKQLEEVIGMIGNQRKERWGKVGRPTKEHIVKKYRKTHPNSWKMQCVRATGLSIKTVSKYWDALEKKEEDTQEIIPEEQNREVE